MKYFSFCIRNMEATLCSTPTTPASGTNSWRVRAFFLLRGHGSGKRLRPRDLLRRHQRCQTRQPFPGLDRRPHVLREPEKRISLHRVARDPAAECEGVAVGQAAFGIERRL